jgi:hypothetical protein
VTAKIEIISGFVVVFLLVFQIAHKEARISYDRFWSGQRLKDKPFATIMVRPQVSVCNSNGTSFAANAKKSTALFGSW